MRAFTYEGGVNKIIYQNETTVWLRLPPHGKICIIDRADLDLVQQHHWYAYCDNPKAPPERQRWEVRRGQRVEGKTVNIYLARVLLDAPDHLMTDHINCTTLDNHRVNLRLCTRSQNLLNARKHINSPYPKGVTARKRKGKITSYQARAWLKGKRIHLGYFKTPELAHEVYAEFAKEHFGEFARVE